MMLDAFLKKTGLALVMAAVALSAACTDDPATPTVNNDVNNTRMEVNPRPPANSQLLHLDGSSCSPAEPICTATVTFSTGRRLSAQLVDADRVPVPNTTVLFEIRDSDAEGSILNAASAETDAEGVAQVELSAGDDAGSVRVVASTNDPNVEPIEFIIAVNPKDASNYNIRFTQIGTSDIKDIRVLYYEDSVSCQQYLDDVRNARLNGSNPTLTAEGLKTGEALPTGELPVIQLTNVPNGTAYTIAAQAFSRANDEVEVAIGCTDMNPPVDSGRPVDVTVALVKNLPQMAADYRVVHTFDISEALPGNIKTIIDLINTLVTDPGAFVVGCDANDPSCDIPTDGLVSIIVNVLPTSGVLGDLRSAIESFLSSNFTQQVARDVINDALENLLQSNDNGIPSWLKDGVIILGDVTNTLKKLEIEGTIRIKREPQYILGADGFPVLDDQGRTQAVWDFMPETCREQAAMDVDASQIDCNVQIWQDIYIFWTRDCGPNAPPECGRRNIPIDVNELSANGKAVSGYFDGTVYDGRELVVNQHTLTLNYGLLILAFIEKVVLPEVFGPDIDSIEDLLDEVLRLIFGAEQGMTGCQGLAADADDVIGGVSGIVENLCDQLLGQATDGIREFMRSQLTLEGGDYFLIATPVGKGCVMTEPEAGEYQGDWAGAPGPYTNGFGTPEMTCEWDVQLNFGSETANMPGTFIGTRN